MKQEILKQIKVPILLIILTIGLNKAFCQCSHNGTYPWTTNTVEWTSQELNYDFVINSGYELILNRTYYVAPGVNIIVNEGGRLTITNAHLSVEQSCNTKFWDGIIVNGDDGNQYNINGSQKSINFADFGYVYIRNSTIMHMDGGIKLVDGGIIDAEGSSFINNRISIEFSSYYPVKPQGWPTQYIYNASKIEACNFYWDNWLVDFSGQGNTETDYSNYTHIKVWDDQRVALGGNYYSNWDGNQYEEMGRGTGIYASANSSFAVVNSKLTGFEAHCPQYGQGNRRSQFRHLSAGIVFDGTNGDTNSRFGLHKARFYHCKTAVNATEGYKNLIAECDFDFTADSSRFDGLDNQTRPVFIKTTGGDLCVIYKSILTTDMEYLNFVHVLNSGATQHFNSIRSCTLSHSNSSNSCYGIYIEDDCTDLRIKCNTFDYIDIDWYIEAGATLGQQGAPGIAHWNKFSKSNDNIANYSGNTLIIYWFDNNDVPSDLLSNPISGNDGNDNSYCVDVDCDRLFSMKDIVLLKQMRFEIYPNPAQDKLFLITRNIDFISNQFIITDNYGRIIQNATPIKDFITEILLNQQTSGLYQIIIFNKNHEHFSIKFLIE